MSTSVLPPWVRPAAIAALVAVALLAVYTRSPAWQTRDVPEPLPGAGPEQVVQLYLEALDAHDEETLRNTVHPSAADGSLLEHDDVRRLRILRLDDPRPVPPAQLPPGAVEAADVTVALELDRGFLRGDPAAPEGDLTRGYRLIRDASGAPWRITAVEQAVTR